MGVHGGALGWLREGGRDDTVGGVNPVLRELVERGGGLVTRAEAGQVVPEWTLQQACRSGDLVRVLPEVFAAVHLLDGRERKGSGTPAISRLHPPWATVRLSGGPTAGAHSVTSARSTCGGCIDRLSATCCI